MGCVLDIGKRQIRVWVPVANIIRDSVVEQCGILTNDGDVVSKILRINEGQTKVADGNLPTCWFI